ncbi:magnesium transporter [Chondromyces crocatus]|uniref:Magnesium transporter MgtE n=1 Tax=Chondromyces crocatus TaxID=52 RepID=A0A0K1E541_CHOCO|nr:magnesium transporter [Chondromyces crocatus]AKT35969.1 magnesium transporter [Chondromyces crocatus]
MDTPPRDVPETPTAEQLVERWSELEEPEARAAAFHELPREESDEFFLMLPAHEQAALLLALPSGERRLWMRLLAPDDAADVLQEVEDEGARAELLGLLGVAARYEVRALLAYEEDAAGGLMSPMFARVRPDSTAEEAVRYLRRQAETDLETVSYGYVLDSEQRLLGVISLRQLIATRGTQKVHELMSTDLVTVREEMDQEEVARVFSQHHLMAIPVVDAEGRMKGIITADDIVDVVEEEATEDIQKLGGMEALDAPYLRTPLLQMVRKRAGWLAALFLGEMLTATAMARYEDEIARAVVLALFVPLIISSGGNSGSQATTLVIRAMALGEVRPVDAWRVLRRELTSGFLLGLVLGTIGFARISVWQALFHTYGEHWLRVAATVSISLVGVVIFGTLAGSLLPFLLRALKFDPASASAPFVATLVDVSGLVIYFTVADLVLRGTML